MRLSLPSGTPCELAVPSLQDPNNRRGIVIAPDIFGLRPLFDDLCAHLASTYGWVVCAVEPFPGREHLSLEERFEAAPTIKDSDYLGDLKAAAELMTEHGATAIGIIGFCMGGMFSLKASGLGSFDRLVSFYGMIRVPKQWKGNDTGEPLDAIAKKGASEVMAIIGGLDHWTPPEDVEALKEAGVQVVIYPEADHGFVHDPSRPAHRPDDAADAWRRVASFLEV